MEEKITITAEFDKVDVAAALMCIGTELTPELWEQIKVAPSLIDFNRIEDKSERLQIKLGLLCLLIGQVAE